MRLISLLSPVRSNLGDSKVAMSDEELQGQMTVSPAGT